MTIKKVYKKWTEKEINYLKENYSKLSLIEIGKHIGRSKGCISEKRRSLKIKKYKIGWNEKEIDFLKKNYKLTRYEDIAKELNKTYKAIIMKARKLNLKLSKEEIGKRVSITRIKLYKEGKIKPRKDSWKQEEIDFLKNNYKIMLYTDIAKKLGKTYGSICKKTQILKLNSNRNGKNNWTKDEEDFIKNNYKILTCRKMSKLLKRTYNSIMTKTSRLGLRIPQKIKSKEISELRKKLFKEGKLKSGFLGKHHNKKTKLILSEINKERFINNPLLIEKIRRTRAKQIFPSKDTSIEIKLQNFLRELEIECYFHVYKKEIKHAYQCDIWIPKYNLVIEADGDYWHGNPIKYTKEQLNDVQLKQKERDELRTKELLDKGFKVWRIWENEIRKMSLEDFKEQLIIKIK